MEHTPLKDRPWMPLAMAALGHIIWGFSVLFSKVAMEVAQPDVLLSIRFLLSAPVSYTHLTLPTNSLV